MMRRESRFFISLIGKIKLFACMNIRKKIRIGLLLFVVLSVSFFFLSSYVPVFVWSALMGALFTWVLFPFDELSKKS